jgi:tRNA A58 N-methylase Trm61
MMIQSVRDHLELMAALGELHEEQMKAEQWNEAYCTYLAMLDQCRRTADYLENSGLRQRMHEGMVRRINAAAEAKEQSKKKRGKK